ncbi:MAG: glycoside hydrolase [Chloroflexi bacterium]|nr:MAG: glycoside hydrolase [Chloroflexota bacterium]
MRKILSLVLLALLFLVACREEEATPAPSPTTNVPEETAVSPTNTPLPSPTTQPATEQPIYLAIIWHQHQPVYFKDPETGIYSKPWVRVHASKDYVDMATTVAQYPNIHVTFNLTPSLIRQLDDLAAGAKDLYWAYTEIPASELTNDQKQFILDRFFDTNRKVIARFPRYQELLTKRDSSDNPLEDYTTQDYLDLQLLFNLAWTDPDWLTEEPLASLVAKERNYTEEDKSIVLAEHLRLIQQVIPVHKELQDAGQIEVTMTPFAHPILPLLISTDLAREALPDIELPPRFTFGADALRQVELGVELYESHFGRPPRGMWPAEGSVAQEMVSMVARNGIKWMASDEGVLANSLGFEGFTRDPNGVVTQPELLYRPYYVEGGLGGPVAIVFRDVVISDKVGFTYSGLDGDVAALDFVNSIHAIREKLLESGAEGPFLVSVILDGENAWEHYDNDGKKFLHSLYQRLSDDPLIKTVTPTEFLEIAPEQPRIEDLFAGSWISHDFATWIGEDEENRAWEYLLTTREMLQKYENGIRTPPSPEALAEAQTLMYIAEGSDWFWWYGADQNSGDDESFDLQFRNTLKAVYTTLGEEPPVFLDVPVIPQQAVSADRPSAGLISPEIDGVTGAEEWVAAGLYLAEGGGMAAASPIFESMGYGFDSQNLYVLINTAVSAAELAENGRFQLYLTTPGGGDTASFSRNNSLLGFPANHLVEITAVDGLTATLFNTNSNLWEETGSPIEQVAIGENLVELAIPLNLLGNADVGDRISMRLIYAGTVTVDGTPNFVDQAQVPGPGPAIVAVPDLGKTTIVLDITDPAGDDHGPGTYTYPTDGVFTSGSYDILNFQVGFDEENIVFRFAVDGPVENVWGSPNGLSIQTFDIYIDMDGDGNGGIALLPGRNLALQAGFAWDYAIHAEGWTSAIYVPGNEGPEQVASANEFQILADPGQQKVTIRVPKTILGDTPEAWRYTAVLLSQEGFPSSGVMRVRDVLPVAEQWRIGGGPANATNHTRVMDMVWPEAGQQEAWLSDYTPVNKPQTELTADDFARVPMLP